MTQDVRLYKTLKLFEGLQNAKNLLRKLYSNVQGFFKCQDYNTF